MYLSLETIVTDDVIDSILNRQCPVSGIKINKATLTLGDDGYYHTRSRKNIPALLALLLLNGRIYKANNPGSGIDGRLLPYPMLVLCEYYSDLLADDELCVGSFGMKPESYNVALAKAQLFSVEYYGKPSQVGLYAAAGVW